MALAPGSLLFVIYAPTDPAGDPVGVLTDAIDKRLVVQRGEPGAGEFVISGLSDQAAWCAPGSYVLAYRDVVTTPDDALGGFWLEDMAQTILSVDEGGGKAWHCGGPGPIRCLEEPIVWNRRVLGGNLARVVPRRGRWVFRRGGSGFAVASVIGRMVREAKRRGAIPFVTLGFTADTDSDSESWEDDTRARRYSVPIGITLTELVTMLRAKGIDVEMRADFTLDAWPDERVNDLSGSIDLEAGVNIAGDVARQVGARRKRSTVLVGGERRRGGERYAVVHNGTYRTQLGRRKEGYRDVGRVARPPVLRRVGRRSLRRWAKTIDGGVGLPVLDADGQIALVDYRPGDTVTVTIPGYYSTGQVVDGISLVDTSTGEYNVVVEFAGLMPDRFTGEDFTDDAATVARGAL